MLWHHYIFWWKWNLCLHLERLSSKSMLGLLNLQIRDYNAANEIFKKVTQIDPKNKYSYLVRGNI